MDLVIFVQSMCQVTLSALAYKIACTKSDTDEASRLAQAERIKEDLERMLALLDGAEECFCGSVDDYTGLITGRTATAVKGLKETCEVFPHDTYHKKDLELAITDHTDISKAMSDFEAGFKGEISDRIEALKKMFQAQLVEVQTIA